MMTDSNIMIKLHTFITESKEICWKRSILGGTSGIFMGIGLGTFLGTFEGAHGDLIGKTPKEQLYNGFKKSFVAGYHRSIYFSKQFAIIGIIYTGFECLIEKERAKHDYINSFMAGLSTGSMLSLWSGRKLPLKKDQVKHTVKGGLSFGLFAVGMDIILEYLSDR